MPAKRTDGLVPAPTACDTVRDSTTGPLLGAAPGRRSKHACALGGEAMEYLDADLDALWHQIRELDNQVVRGETLELSERVRDVLLSAAPTVSIGSDDAEVALTHVESATALLRKIRERIREGSNRIGDALFR